MSRPFGRRRGGISVHLDHGAREVLMSLPDYLDRSGDAGGRLDYRAHPGDPAAEARYRDLVGDSLQVMRREDRAVLAGTVGATTLTQDEAGSWLRVIGEARLALASSLDITDDGWEQEVGPGSDPRFVLLGFLGHLQDRLVAVLEFSPPGR